MKKLSYEQIRSRAVCGDIVGVRGSGIISKIIRYFAGDWSHVAMFIWHGTGLWVYEFRSHGYVCTPASQWFELQSKDSEIYFGKAPAIVRANPGIVLDAASSFRAGPHIKLHYGFLSYPKILWSSVVKKDYPTYMKVCSTFIQFVWELAGYDLLETADPGDIMRISSQQASITQWNGEL